MTNLYEVKMATLSESRVKATGRKCGRPSWNNDGETLKVVANGDAQKAVRKAMRSLVGSIFIWRDSEKDNREVIERITKAKLISVERVCEIDVP